jgi:2-hydroxychromene-2-carboxylate isomerase
MADLTVTYFYSAYAYIGHQAFLKLAHQGGRTVVHKTFKLMKCLVNIGYQPLEERTGKTLDYQFNRHRNRWAEFRSIQISKVTPFSDSNGAEIADLVLLSAI